MKKNKGFTLVEVLVSLGLLTIIIAAFGPLMLSSLQNVKLSGDIAEDTYSAKGEMENLIALGVQSDEKQLVVNYTHTGTAEKADNVIVEGQYLSTGTTGYVKLDTFVAKDIGTISISPSSISENCAPYTTIIDITSDLIEFTDVANFKLTNKKGGVMPNSDTEFKLDPNNPNHAQMIIKNNANILITDGPYKVCYNSGYAVLHITPAPVIAVGSNGVYYARNENGNWVPGKKISNTAQDGKIGTATLLDAVWTGTQYVTAGENGAYYYTDDEGWQNKSTGNSRHIITDLLYSQVLENPIYATGYLTYNNIIYPAYSYTQMMADPSRFEFKEGARFRKGKRVTDGFIGNEAVGLWAYDEIQWIYDRFNYSFISLNNQGSIGDDIGNQVIAIDSNRKQGAESEFLIATADRIYSLRPSDLDRNWKDVTSTYADDMQEIQSTKYYYSILDYNAKNGYPEEHYIVRDSELKISNKKIEIDSVWYDLTSGAGKDEKSDRRQIVNIGTIQSSQNGSKLSTTNFKDISCVDKVWLLAGGDISVQDYSNGAIMNASVQKPAKWAGNGWKDNASNIEAIIKKEDLITNTKTSKIVYNHDGLWHASPLPASVGAGVVINKVEFIGDRCFAVGTNGTILSISTADLVAGKEWTKETGLAGNIPNTLTFNGVAGWGN